MLTPQDVYNLLSDIESDRIERTVSTTNTDKFGQAICAIGLFIKEKQKKDGGKEKKDGGKEKKELEKQRKGTEKQKKDPKKEKKGVEKQKKDSEKEKKGAEKQKKDPQKEKKEILRAKNKRLLELISSNPSITYEELSEHLHLSSTPIYSRIKKLKEAGIIQREGGRTKGIWLILSE